MSSKIIGIVMMDYKHMLIMIFSNCPSVWILLLSNGQLPIIPTSSIGKGTIHFDQGQSRCSGFEYQERSAGVVADTGPESRPSVQFLFAVIVVDV